MKLSTTTGVIAKKFGHEKAIEMISKAGFDAYDMDMCKIHVLDTPISSNDYLDYIKQLKCVADRCGIVCNQAHAPFPTQLNGNDEYNKKTFEMIIRSMECASLLGAKIIVMHPIKSSSSSGNYEYVPFESKEQLYNANIDFFKKLIMW